MMRIFAPKALKIRKQMEVRESPEHVHDYKYTSATDPFKKCICGLETLDVDWMRKE